MPKPAVPVVGDLKLWREGAAYIAKTAPQLNANLSKLGAFPKMSSSAHAKIITAVANVLKKMPEVVKLKYNAAQTNALAQWVWNGIQGRQFLNEIFGVIFRSRL